MKRDSRNKSVFLITIDALRPDHLKSYGYHKITAPNLEKFVKNGTTFLNAITNGPETPSAFRMVPLFLFAAIAQTPDDSKRRAKPIPISHSVAILQ